MKVPEPENVLIVFLIIAFIALILLFINGCTAMKVADTHITWTDGDCTFVATNLSAEAAKNISDKMTLDKCAVRFGETEKE